MNVAYFAYGSNLDRSRMQRRCPRARVVGKAVLHGYRIVFCGHSRTWGGGVASLVPEVRSHVDGVLYRLARADLERLDRFEGVPRMYQRAGVRVWDAQGARRRAHVYCQIGATVAAPPARYLNVIAHAYRRLGFDLEPLVRALKEVV